MDVWSLEFGIVGFVDLWMFGFGDFVICGFGDFDILRFRGVGYLGCLELWVFLMWGCVYILSLYCGMCVCCSLCVGCVGHR